MKTRTDNPKEQSVLVVGGGIAGLSTAVKLATLNIASVIVDKAPFLGGHAVQYACKATDTCVKCGACVVEEKWRQVVNHPLIEVLCRSRVAQVSQQGGRYQVRIEKISGEAAPQEIIVQADAVVVATGFKPFDPEIKPYGYKRFANVITNLDLERILREKSFPLCPSDNRNPEKIAFVQCVGSRDAKLGHLWCSKVCCASALRMARLIKTRREQTEITIFYIDIQSFGKTFAAFYAQIKSEFRWVRAIPGDIFQTEDDRLRVVYYHAGEKQILEDAFDLVVLSVGMTPSEDNRSLAELFGLTPAATGFLQASADTGVFTAGAVCGPASIAESAAGADRAALQAAIYLHQKSHEHS